MAAGLLFVAGWLIATLFNAWRGRQQVRDGRGTRRRLWKVAAIVGLMQSASLLAGTVLSWFVAEEIGRWELLAVAAAGYGATFWLSWNALGPTAYWLAGGEALPEVTDQLFLNRYHDLCGKMNLRPPPTVRMMPTPSGVLETSASVGGLASPTVIVSDGTIYRLQSNETQAILAHELAHIANRSLWCYATAWIVFGPTAAVLLTPWHSPVGSVLLALTMTYGVRTVVSRWFETDCDLRGARAAGFGASAAALQKAASGLPVDLNSWEWLFAESMSNHPLYDVRMGTLARNAPANDPVTVAWSPGRRSMSVVVSVLAVLFYGSWLAYLVLHPGRPITFIGPIIYLAVWFLLPAFLFQAASLKAERRQATRPVDPRDLTGGWPLWPRLQLFGAALGFMVVTWLIGRSIRVVFVDREPGAIMLGVPAAVIGLAVLVLSLTEWWHGAHRDRRRMLQLFQLQRWNDFITLAESKPKRVAGDAMLWSCVAISKWFSGKESEALQDLDGLAEALPDFALTYHTRGALLLDRGDPRGALADAGRSYDLDPHDYEVYLLAALAYFRLDDLEAVEKQLAQADRALANQPTAAALRAAVAAKRGDLETAADLFDRAESLSPAMPLVRLLAAEVTLEHGPIEEAERQITDASRLIHAAPLCLLQKQLQRLVAKCSELKAESGAVERPTTAE